MAMYFSSSPKNGEQLVQNGLVRVVARGLAAPAHLRQINLNSAKIRDAHAVYDLGLDAIRAGADLTATKRSAVRYIVDDANKPIVAAEVLVDGNERATLLANLNSGPFVASSAQALSDLARSAEVKAGSFEVRLLRVAPLAVMAVWLKSDTAEPDIIYPIVPAPSYLKAGRLYSASDFLAALRPAAAARLAVANPKTTS